jgi:hypothetical protein
LWSDKNKNTNSKKEHIELMATKKGGKKSAAKKGGAKKGAKKGGAKKAAKKR